VDSLQVGGGDCWCV